MSRRKPKLNFIDRAVGFFNPRAGYERARSRVAYDLVSGYAGARRDKGATSTWSAGVASADADTLPDLDVLRARSRDLVRNDPLAQSAISTKVVNVIGTGHIVLPEIDAKRLGLSPTEKVEWEEAAFEIWNDWAESADCDITRTQCFAELEDLVYRSRLLSGDVQVVKRFKERRGRLLATAIQVIEADRLSNPNWKQDTEVLAGGVGLDRDGAPVRYHFANRHPLDRNRGKTTWSSVPAFDATGRRLVLHIHGARWRPEMTRYAPLLAPVIESLKQRSRYSEAELMAAVISACFAIGMKSPEGGLSDGLATVDNEQGAGSDITITEPGQIFDLMPDEELQSFEPGRPNAQFEPFISAIAKEVGAGTDLPYEMLVKQFQASYSASRAALEMAWQFFRVERAHHVTQFCKPIYEEVIGEAVARRLLRAPGFFRDPLARRAWLGSVWIGPARPTIDPTKDASADEKYLGMKVTTRTRIAAERFGADYRQIVARLKREQEALGALATEPSQQEPKQDPPSEEDEGENDDAIEDESDQDTDDESDDGTQDD